MKIKQNDVTEDTSFRGSLAKDIQNNIFPGITYRFDNQVFFWEIDDNIFCNNTLDNIKEKFGKDFPEACNEFITFFRPLISNPITNNFKEQTLTVTEFLNKWMAISKANNDNLLSYFTDIPYTIQGEVYNYYIDREKETVRISLMQYTNGHNYFLIVRFFQIPSNINLLKQYTVIQVSGHPYITSYRYDNLEYCSAYREKVYISGDSFKVVSDEPEIITEWKRNIDSIWYEKKKADFESPFETIDLIVPKDSSGESDFKSVIGNSFICKVHPMSLKVLNIVETIQNLNKNGSCECICIVRGGGNPYDLIHFSNPKLLKAIYESTIPIVIGIGHSTDDERLECNKIADKACINPSETARFFLELKNKWNKNYTIWSRLSRIFE